jgi:transcriptional repressor of cell division inhibition gene dicB
MTPEQAIKHFKSAANVARALGISRAAVTKWGDLIPEGSAYKLESLSGGALRVDPSLYTKGSSEQRDSEARVA